MQILVPLALALGLVLLFLAVCAVGRGWLAWVLSGAVGLAAVGAGGAWSSPWYLAVAVPFVLAAVLFGVVPVRRALLGRVVLKGVGAILPRMSETEKEALDAGTVWWDADLFGGAPEWRKLLEFRPQELSASERAFLDGPVEELCRMLDDHRIAQDGDLPAEVWSFIREKGFMGMIVPESYGGLGFSGIAHSAVVTKLSTRSGVASVTVMVPNSLGPAELLHHYGTEEQKDYWLPRLARGEEVPCFALTEPGAGSDAGSMTSSGVVCKGEWEGEEVLGMRLTWNKRYITLAPVATVVGLAFKLSDPEHLLGETEDLGITCALIPADTPGVVTGERHDPLGVPFMNGTTHGEDVFVPLEFIIGGAANAGRGWRMLMQSLAAGRGISLPSLSAGACQLAVRATGAYATVREQFGLPIGKFEGVQEPLARIAGLNYAVDAARLLTVGAIDAGEKPSVVTAMVKAWSTEAMRSAINDAMDVVGGAGISRGPRNVLAALYQAVPIGITVEGANILTRTMIVFGQGAMRCHPWVQKELETNAAKDVAGFDAAFFGHVNHVFTNAGRAFFHGLCDGAFATVPVSGEAGRALKRLTRSSAAFALLADVAMGTLGGALKRKEAISGRLADALAWQYFGSAIVARYVRDGLPERDRPAFRWAIRHALFEIERAMLGLLQNLPNRPAAWLMRRVVFPVGARRQPPSDRIGSALARAVLEGGALREALSKDVFLPGADEEGLGRLESALRSVLAARPAEEKVRAAQRARKLPKGRGVAVYDAALGAGVIGAEERKALDHAAAARTDAVQVDAFTTESAHAGAL